MPQANRLQLPSAPLKVQQNNKRAWNAKRSAESADFFTIGYAGRQTEEFFETLVEYGVRTLIDVREVPVSMYKPDFSKKNLAAHADRHGLIYVHLPELGVPRDVRVRAIDTGSRDAIWEWYDEYVVEPYIGGNLHSFLNMVDHPAALMCVELDPLECHRHRLVLALEALGMKGYDL